MAVTAFAAAYGAFGAGLGAGAVALLAAAVLAGQLSVGWSNDWVDAARDTTGGRTDKPVPAGLVPRWVVGLAAVLALTSCVPLSLALGVLPGGLHLVAVGSAWSYNLMLKRTTLSPVPYALSFGLLVAAAGTAAGRWPEAPVIVAAALLGVAAHFANTVADTEVDARTGVRGLPQRVGPVRSLGVTATLVAAAALVLLLAGSPPVAGTVLLVGGAVLACCSAWLARPGGRHLDRAFRVTLLAVALVVAGFLLGG